ncbi:hypothetical protein AB0F17_43060 [Nonomuraea sp. NPDC026600]|uniref:hypothetical protein n=1 Tax=Nonomuraea sp. NPDC026600 TaxID=3155363 RepID=UPI0033DB76F1
MPGLFPLKKTRAPDRLHMQWPPAPPPPRTIPWHVITRQYSPKSRRTFRRILLAAKARGIHVTVQHDNGKLFRLHLLKLTGTPAVLGSFRKLLDCLHPHLGLWWAR